MKIYFTLILILLNSMAFSEEITSFCKPNSACWPSLEEWQSFRKTLTGKLEIPQSLIMSCLENSSDNACANLKNPFFVSDQAGGTQTTGWLGAWTSSVSAYSVAAENSQDIVSAVKFARKHNLRMVIKSTGHDYLGRSNAPDSLLVWTHNMQKVSAIKNFKAEGCTDGSGDAVTSESGATWFHAYREVTVNNGRYVQGGGCTSVGVAGGFMQGGGFGSWSKKYGTAASNMLEAEVVTADGRLLTANACQNQDLFWALRGGGGGTFGIVTKVTLKTHELPNYFGIMNGKIQAKSDGAFKELLKHFVDFYFSSLNNEHWGEQVKINSDNSIDLRLAIQGLSTEEAKKVWLPFSQWIDSQKENIAMNAQYVEIPGEKMWDNQYIKNNIPGMTVNDQDGERFWWIFDSEQVSTYWYAFESRWLPQNLFDPAHSRDFSLKLFEASRFWPLEIQINKGQAGASKEAVTRGRSTSMNPAVFQATALLIAAANTDKLPGTQTSSIGENIKRQVHSAMSVIRDVTPGSGTYLNEADYFEANWQREFWGDNYKKLLDIKRKYDPNNVFICHHCVGSEDVK